MNPSDTSRQITAGSINDALRGVRVLDFTQIGAGPLAAMQLGDMGADVIKIEAPGGDIGRKLGPPWQEGESVVSMSFNRNKRAGFGARASARVAVRCGAREFSARRDGAPGHRL